MPVFIEDFAKSISDRCEVHVLAPHTKGAKLYEDLKGVQVFRFRYAPDQFERFGAGISVIEIVRKDPWTLLMIPILVLAGASWIVALEFRNRYDVIHVHWLVPFGPVVGILRTFANFRYVVTSHGSDVWAFAGNPSRIGRVVSWTHRAFTFRRVDKLVFVSHALREALAGWIPGIPSGKVAVIGMGIDYGVFSEHEGARALHDPLKNRVRGAIG